MKLISKKIRNFLTILTLLIVANACNVTDVQPINNLSDQSAFSSLDNVSLTVAGMYDAAQSGFYDPLNGTGLVVRGYPFGAASIQQGDNRGADVLNVAAFFAFTYNTTYTTGTANNVNMWSTLFALINQCNFVIDGVRRAGTSGTISSVNALAFEGEARFLRALAYHELSIHFARPFSDATARTAPRSGLPIRNFPVTSDAGVQTALSTGRSTIQETYNFILADLDFAEANLPNRGQRAGVQQVTRATKAAPIALKTRVKLHMEDWAGVVAEAQKLVTGTGPFSAPAAIGGYALQASPAAPFSNNSSAESIFSIENNAQDNSGVNGALGAMFQAAPAGRGLIAISPLMWNDPSWLASDTRRTTTAILGGDNRRWLNKYRDGVNYTDFAPIIRYAEVILNYAEAEAQLNGVSTIDIALINEVRNRGVGVGNQFTMASFGSTAAFLTAVYNERRIELLGEGRSWADNHRRKLPIPAKVLNAAATAATYNAASGVYPTTGNAVIPYTDFRYLWPIPAVEIANNPTLATQQNPGW